MSHALGAYGAPILYAGGGGGLPDIGEAVVQRGEEDGPGDVEGRGQDLGGGGERGFGEEEQGREEGRGERGVEVVEEGAAVGCGVGIGRNGGVVCCCCVMMSVRTWCSSSGSIVRLGKPPADAPRRDIGRQHAL